MARPTLPRFVGDVVVAIEVAGTDEADALERLRAVVDEAVRDAVVKAVRNHGSRTARVVNVDTIDDHGPDSMARQ